MDGVEIVGNDVYPLTVLIYGQPEQDEMAGLRQHLEDLRISFVEVNIEEDERAARYVERINHGERLTPTIVFGDEDFIIVQPDRTELNKALRRAGYDV